MSIDLKIQNKCDHRINWEDASLQSDRRTIYLTSPVGSRKSLVLRINNVVIDTSQYSIQDDKEPELVPRSFLFMKRKLKIYDPLIEVQYYTMSNFCPKCLGHSIIDDIIYQNRSDVKTVKNEALLVQNIEKYIITALNSNKYHLWMGSGLQSLAGSKVFDTELIKTRIRDNISQAINKLRSIQDQHIATGREVTPGELLDTVISINVENPSGDPSLYMATVTFTSRSGKTLEYDQFLELNALRRRFVS